MSRRPPARPVTERLADRDAARLLARASELDAASADATVTELRQAAAEAGISDRAFDAALAEMKAEDESRPLASHVPPRSRRRARTMAVLAAMLIGFATVTLGRTAIRTSAGAGPNVPMVEEAILLRCLTGDEAATLVRPLLSGEQATVLVRAKAPRVLTIRATPQQLREVRALLDRHEAAGSSACTAAPASGARQ